MGGKPSMGGVARNGKGNVLTHIRGILLVVPWLVWLLVIDLIVSSLLPFKALFPDAVYDISSNLAWTVWRSIQQLFEKINSADVTISGDAIPQEETAIVVANHLAWTDFYLIQALAIRAGMLSRCRYFAKIQLRVVPFLGWGLWALGMPLVSRNWLKDRKELDKVFRDIVTRRWPTWLIAFSEATRFTPAKYAESQAWCTAQGKPQPQHLLYPRTKGFITTVQHLRQSPHVKAVYDVAIAYHKAGVRGSSSSSGWQQAPTFWDTVSLPRLSAPQEEGGQGFRFRVHAWRFPIEELPQTDGELALWLEQRWVEKGVWLENLRKQWAEEETLAAQDEKLN